MSGKYSQKLFDHAKNLLQMHLKMLQIKQIIKLKIQLVILLVIKFSIKSPQTSPQINSETIEFEIENT